MADVIPRKGQRVVVGSAYMARGFRLAAGEVLADDPQDFDRQAHAPKLVQLQKDEVCEALTGERAGQLYVKAERDGEVFACWLLPDSYDVIA